MRFFTHNYKDIPLHFAYRRNSANNEYKETFHSHMGVELLLIHQGKGTLIVNNIRYEIKPNMFCIFQPHQLHHLQLDYSDETCFERSLAIFEPTMFEAYFEKWPSLHTFYTFMYMGKLQSPCIYEIDDAGALDSAFKSLAVKLPSIAETEKIEAISLFLVILVGFLQRLWDNKDNREPTYRHRRKSHRIEHVLNWIEAHYNVPYRLEDMAKSLHLSPYHLSHLFKEATGISITEYITTRRIHQSVLLLTTTNKPVSLIAEEIGLVSASYFCKIFKAHMGITPHQYRKSWTDHSFK